MYSDNFDFRSTRYPWRTWSRRPTRCSRRPWTRRRGRKTRSTRQPWTHRTCRTSWKSWREGCLPSLLLFGRWNFLRRWSTETMIEIFWGSFFVYVFGLWTHMQKNFITIIILCSRAVNLYGFLDGYPTGYGSIARVL